MTPLDQSIFALCERHALLSASVSCIRLAPGLGYHANVQWADASQVGGRNIAMGGGDTFAAALNDAVTAMLVKRGSAIAIPGDALELKA